MKPERRMLLLGVLPHALGLAFLLGFILWGLGQPASSQIHTVAGALAIWVGEHAILLTCFAIRYSLLRDPDAFGDSAMAVVKKRQSLFTMAMPAGPGLWIGLVSRSPVAAVIATWVAIMVVVLFNRLRLGQLERRRYDMGRVVIVRFGKDLVLMCGWALLGRLLTWWG